ncbi:MAG TPA: B-box zinc finger protein [bacterium]|nr:B-box zinc finger protein [bacterium]
MKCATHPDRNALGYCAQCGKPLCKECLVKLRTGNYCEVCANNPGGRVIRPRRRFPWWTIALVVMGILALASVLHTLIH